MTLFKILCAQPAMRFYFLALVATFLLMAILPKPAITVGGGVLGLISVGALIHMRSLFGVSRLVMASCAALLILIVISGFYGADRDDSVAHLMRWVFVFPLGLAMIGFVRRSTAMPSIRAWGAALAALAFGALYVILSDMTGYQLQRWAYPYDSFEPTDFNKGIAAIVILSPAVLYPLWVMGGRMRMGAAGVAALVAVMAFMSYSQAAGFAVLIIALGTLMPVRSRKFWRVVRVVTVAGVLGLPFLMPYAYQNWAAPMQESTVGRYASGAQRLEIWAAVSDEIAKAPIFGHGYNAARVMEFPEIQKKYFWDTQIAHTHNFVLQAWLEFGAVGAILLAVFLVLMWRRIQAVQDRPTRRMYFMTATATIGLALVGWNLWQTWWIVLLFITATTAILSARMMGQGPVTPHSK
jgi:O-antigen ligase